jgi:hypothetical protein
MTMTNGNNSPRFLLLIVITLIFLVFSCPLLTAYLSLWGFTWARGDVGEQLNTKKKVEKNKDLEMEKDFFQKYQQLAKSEFLSKYKKL